MYSDRVFLVPWTDKLGELQSGGCNVLTNHLPTTEIDAVIFSLYMSLKYSCYHVLNISHQLQTCFVTIFY